MAPENLLILSDSASGITGLGRIGRDLALNIHRDLSDVFRVGVCGVGGNYSSRLPFPNYPIQNLQNMVPVDLPRIWQDFAGDDGGTDTCDLEYRVARLARLPRTPSSVASTQRIPTADSNQAGEPERSAVGQTESADAARYREVETCAVQEVALLSC